MKIGMLTERMKLGFGVDLVVHEQASRLAKLGHQVSVFVISADERTHAANYDLVTISKIVDVHDYSSELSINKILDELHARKIDLWILHTPPFYDWLSYLRAPAIIVEYGTPPGSFFDADTARHLERMTDHRFTNIYSELGWSDAIVSISRSIHEWLPARAKLFSSVVYLGGDHYERASSEQVGAFRRSIGVADDECLILWVGRMQFADDEQPYKNFAELLSLIPKIRRRCRGVKIALLGKIAKEELSKLDSYEVILLAGHPREEMGVAYAAADILINLSRWEGFNLALVEAQYQGTPVVAYDIGPHPEVVANEKTGMLVQTPDDMLAAIDSLVGDRELRETLSRNARSFADGFTWDANVAKLAALIADCHGRSFAASSAFERKPKTDLAVAEFLAAKQFSLDQLLALDGEKFIRAAYQAVLGRDADAGGLQLWLGRRRSGESKLSILTSLCLSSEGKQLVPHPSITQAVRFYRFSGGRHLNLMLRFFGLTRSLNDVRLQLRRLAGQQDAVGAGLRKVIAVRRKLLGILPARRPALQPPQDASDIRQQLQRLEERQDVLATDLAQRLADKGAPEPASVREWFLNQRLLLDACPLTVRKGAVWQSRIGPRHVALVAPGASLEPSALSCLAKAVERSQADIVFGDEVEEVTAADDLRLRARGLFSHDAFMQFPDLGGVIAVHDAILAQASCPETVALTGSVLLRLVARAHSISHIPSVLNRRSSAAIGANLPSAADVGVYLGKICRGPVLHACDRHGFDVRYPANSPWKAAIIVTSYGGVPSLARRIEAIEASTEADRYKLIIVNGDAELSTQIDSLNPRYQVLHFPRDTSACVMFNAAARQAPQDCNLFTVLNGDVMPALPDWLPRLAEACLRNEVGAVAPLSIYPDGRVSHAGMVVGLMGICGHVSRFTPYRQDDGSVNPGYLQWLVGVREVSAVSSACIMICRRVFLELGGFDENLSNDASDIDLSFRLRAVGLRVLLDARAVVRRHDPIPRHFRPADTASAGLLAQKHAAVLAEEDPFFNPLLSSGCHEPTPALQYRTVLDVEPRTVSLAPWELR
ncbi:glycosyltransferase [Bradyrhizobium prioriisuperbiae]|uniref:glycosyltransferase n=1 Tax=Bradyrhizobium prioriisuperbiae TaxID=2854389 RepID=UPI0028F09966|nr:glycosyltransferase [Bradyrhizobium prioritasuperba]